MQKADASTRGHIDWVLLAATAALLAIGLMMVYSSTFALGYLFYNDPSHYIKRQCVFVAIGLGAMLVMSRINYRHLTKVSILMMVGVLGLLVYLVLTRRGRHMFGESFSPVELAKLAVIVYIAHWLASKRVEQLRRLPVGLLPFTIIVGFVTGLVLAQPDISEAIVIVLVSIAMFFLAGADVMQFAIGLLGGAGAFTLVISRMPAALERLKPFFLSWRNPLESTNEQLRQGVIALGSGGFFGLGPGNGRMSHRWLPAAYTDSIFAIVGEELGLAGCLLIIVLFGVVAYRGFLLVRRAQDPFGRLLAAGITCWFSLQALINLAVVTSTIPFTGIALPFISLGGTSLVTSLIGTGILLSISRTVARQGVEAGEARSVRGWDGRTRLPSLDSG